MRDRTSKRPLPLLAVPILNGNLSDLSRLHLVFHQSPGGGGDIWKKVTYSIPPIGTGYPYPPYGRGISRMGLIVARSVAMMASEERV
jgi:hypothetical protein